MDKRSQHDLMVLAGSLAGVALGAALRSRTAQAPPEDDAEQVVRATLIAPAVMASGALTRQAERVFGLGAEHGLVSAVISFGFGLGAAGLFSLIPQRLRLQQ